MKTASRKHDFVIDMPLAIQWKSDGGCSSGGERAGVLENGFTLEVSAFSNLLGNGIRAVLASDAPYGLGLDILSQIVKLGQGDFRTNYENGIFTAALTLRR